MSETGIYSALTNDSDVSGLVSTRVYPVIAPQNVTAPYVVYQRITGAHLNDLDGSLGISDVRFQVDAYATTYAQAKTLAGYIKTALGASALKSRLLTDQDFDYDLTAEVYRVSMDFKIWVTE